MKDEIKVYIAKESFITRDNFMVIKDQLVRGFETQPEKKLFGYANSIKIYHFESGMFLGHLDVNNDIKIEETKC